jgi:hypothetical protein
MRWIFTAAVLLLTQQSQATNVITLYGAISGGGGKGTVCRDHTGAILSAKLLDLWEAETLYAEKPLPSTGSLQADLDAAIARLRNVYVFHGMGGFDDKATYQDQDYIAAYLDREAHKFLQANPLVVHLRGVQLALTDDSYEIAQPSGCKVEQIVNYQPNGRVFIDDDIYDHLDYTNRAALITHEALYQLLRRFVSEPNSIRVRRAIGFVFAGNSFVINEATIPDDAITCRTGDIYNSKSVVVLYPAAQQPPQGGKVEAIFTNVDGSQLIGLPTRTFQAWIPQKIQMAKDILVDTCSTVGTYSGSIFRPDGPVEFDRSLTLTWQCHSNQVKLFLSITKSGSNQVEESELNCEVPN